ncbi:MAG: hypothetical protein GF308_13495 [Candidatus Heimdallarchaeota archaeon]|nr:hypothetical protein [Candidatus Heimdallarchaeota archaeon]
MEKEIGEIPRVTKIERGVLGVKVEEGPVVELGLTRKEKSTLLKIISQLSKLQKLDQWANKWTKLLETIGKLTNLTALYLAYNNLTKLPETIGKLPNIEKIHLTANKFTKLPEKVTSWLQELTEKGRLVFGP